MMINRELGKGETSFQRQVLHNYAKVTKSILSGLTHFIHDNNA